ncbi:MAG: hemolysin III family protein [Pseudoxanthomonas sp.]
MPSLPTTAGAGSTPAPHYRSAGARRADLGVHLAGLLLALAGGGALVALAALRGETAMVRATIAYVLGLLAMFACSAAYNFAAPTRQPLLRRLDHAGIFFMIAGSYTPPLAYALAGAWRWSMLATVWGVALASAACKLWLPGLGRGFWVAVYLLLGWVGLAAIGPLWRALDGPVLALIGAGGLVYSLGVAFYLRKGLVYFRAIWHGHVLAAALLHWLAILRLVQEAG